MGYLYLSLAIICEVAGSVGLKLSEGFTKFVPASVTVVGYGLAFYLLSLTLQTLSLGFAYAVWAGVGIVLLTIIGVLFLGESVDWPGVLGIGLIVSGVVVLNLFSQMNKH
ncbi:DMT family transporter [Magnetococcus sp. PR-3]|uniref:DMT family transporter n=1 Tax=Magnetococcus sp. PR-3 TaxID=3120355 RepID=UPI002FCE5E6B